MDHALIDNENCLQSANVNLLKNSIVLKDEEWEALRINFVDRDKYISGELFKTEHCYYAFDYKNVCFLKLNHVTFDMLSIMRERQPNLDELIVMLPQHPEDDIRQAYSDFIEAQADGLLLPYHFQRIAKYDNSRYEEILSEKMGGFIVFITTRCNLGCSYCIYKGQYGQHESLSRLTMPWSTVKNMMEFLQAHSNKSKSVRLDFFGGEPLLAFKIIKRGVEYLKKIIDPEGPEVIITISSNGTVITDEIIDFLLSHGVYLQFSMDGGKQSHDRYRTLRRSNRGSFKKIMNNLQKIYDRDSEYFRKHIRLKGVITTETLDHADQDFFEHPLISIVLREGNYSFLEEEPHYDLAKDADYFNRLHKLGNILLKLKGVRTDSDITKRLNVKQTALYRHTFSQFFGAQVVSQVYFYGMDSTHFTKECLIGYQEGAVSANGDISICLKSAKGKNFVIGNVNEGKWYYDKMKALNNLIHQDWAGCSFCYLQKICDLCYEKLNGEEGKFVTGRTNFCEFNREKYRIIFQYMLQVCEHNPELWGYLNQLMEDKINEKLKKLTPEGIGEISKDQRVVSL